MAFVLASDAAYLRPVSARLRRGQQAAGTRAIDVTNIMCIIGDGLGRAEESGAMRWLTVHDPMTLTTCRCALWTMTSG